MEKGGKVFWLENIWMVFLFCSYSIRLIDVVRIRLDVGLYIILWWGTQNSWSLCFEWKSYYKFCWKSYISFVFDFYWILKFNLCLFHIYRHGYDELHLRGSKFRLKNFIQQIPNFRFKLTKRIFRASNEQLRKEIRHFKTCFFITLFWHILKQIHMRPFGFRTLLR